MTTKSYNLARHGVCVDTSSGEVVLYGNSRMSFTLKEASELLTILSHHLIASENVTEVSEDIDALNTRYISHNSERRDRVKHYAHSLVSTHLLECEHCTLTKFAMQGISPEGTPYREGVSAIVACVSKNEGLAPYLPNENYITREVIEKLVLRELTQGYTFSMEDTPEKTFNGKPLSLLTYDDLTW